MHPDATTPDTIVCQHCGATVPRRYFSRPQPFCGSACANAAKTTPVADRFWSKVSKSSDPDGCWEWTESKTRSGYGVFTVSRHRKSARAHRIAWELVNGPIPEGMEVLHTCDVRHCVRNDEPGVYVVNGIECPRSGHLFLGTTQINSADRHAKGRDAHCRTDGTPYGFTIQADNRGERSHTAKLTWEEVREIRTAYTGAYGQIRALAREYGVGERTIQRIIAGDGWKG